MTRLTRYRFLTCTLLITALPGLAAAQSVRSPYVKQGALKLEHKGSYSFDDADFSEGTLENEFEIGYGLTDRIAVELEAKTEDESGDHYRYDATKIAAKYQLTEKGAYWIDAGIYLGYKFPSDPNASDEASVEFLFSKDMEQWRHRANLNFDKEIGKNRSKNTEMELEWQTFYKVSPATKAGVEYFADFKELSERESFDDQSHIVGPVAQHTFANGLEVQVGYLFGISDAAPDGTIKWKLEYKF